MDKIEKIRQEIELLRREIDDHNYYLDNSEQALGYSAALDDIEKFLDTLEEPDKSLEEAAEEYAQLDDKGIWKDGGKYKGFIAGAEWMEKEINKELIKAMEKVHEIRDVDYDIHVDTSALFK